MESASDSSWEVSESEEEGSQDANEEQEAIEKELPRRKNGRKSTVASWLPYNELCDIQCVLLTSKSARDHIVNNQISKNVWKRRLL